MREASCGQDRIGPNRIVSGTDRRVWPYQDLAGVFQIGQNSERFTHQHLKVFRGKLIDELNCLAHRTCQDNTTCPVWSLKACTTKILPPLWQRRDLVWQ